MPTPSQIRADHPAATPLGGEEPLHTEQGSAGSVGVTVEEIAQYTDTRTTEVVVVCLFTASEDVATGDLAGGQILRIPSKLDGCNLVAVAAYHAQAGTGAGSDTTSVQVHNITDGTDLLSTEVSIDEDELDSATAATSAVIDTTHDDVATGDQLRFDVDAITTVTAPKGLWVELQFRRP